ncbi:MAG: V-type ATP synthase subunit I [Candidatus Thorarchaeota archaeon]
MIEPMFHTHIWGLKSDALEFSNHLRSLKAFHVIPTTTEETGFSAQFKEMKVDLESLETRIASILSFVPSESPLDDRSTPLLSAEEIFSSSKDILSSIEPDIKRIQSEKRRLEGKIRQLERYSPILDRVRPLISKMEEKGTFESLIVMLDRRAEVSVAELESEIDSRTKGVYEIYQTPVDEYFDAILLLIDNEQLRETQAYLTGERLSELSFPPEIRNIRLKDMKNTVDGLIESHRNSLSELEQEQDEISKSKDLLTLRHLQNSVVGRLAEFQLIEKMGGTTDTFEITGFVPKSKIKTFESSIQERFNKRIIITKEKARRDAPVLRRNMRIVRPFETITDMIQLPEYGTMDPTPFIAVLFPLFWGFMVGDAGYAAVIFLISFLMRIRFKRNNQKALQNITEIFMIACVSAVFFGILYFEIFGDLGERFVFDVLGFSHGENGEGGHGAATEAPIFPLPLLNRYTNVQELLIISIIIGYAIILGGMVLSILNNFRLRHMSHVYSNFLLIYIWGSVSVLIFIALGIPSLFEIALIGDLIVILIAIGGLLKFDGIAGLIHVIEKFSNILSFARLMAIGLVGAWMGKIANDLILIYGGTLGIFSVLMGLALHGINLLILVLSPSIHAMRLNVYEFFSQFVIQGGNTFHAFGTET